MLATNPKQSIITFLLVWRAIAVGAQIFRPPQTSTEPCGDPAGCYCSGPILHLITCTNISVFPTFPEEFKPGVTYIDIYQSQLTFLESFHPDQWFSLEYVDLRSNNKLPCWVVQNVIERKGLTVLSDCNYTVGDVKEDWLTWMTSAPPNTSYNMSEDLLTWGISTQPNTHYNITPNIPNEDICVNVPSNTNWLAYLISLLIVYIAVSTAGKLLHLRRKQPLFRDRNTDGGKEEGLHEPINLETI